MIAMFAFKLQTLMYR